MDSNLPPTGLRGHLGIRIASATKEKVLGEMTADERHINEHGRLHGGALMAFADELGARGAVLNLPPGAATTTLESKTNFFRPCRPGIVAGEAVPLHLGRRTMVWQTSVHGPDGARVALVTQTQMVLAPEGGASEARLADASRAAPEEKEAPVPTRIQKERRDQILEAACRVIAEKGFANATMREIAAAAGMHVPTMYQYVRGKDELLEEIFVTCLKRIGEEVAAVVVDADPPRERLRRAIQATLESYDRNKTPLRLMSRETKALDPEVRARVLRQRADFIGIFARLVEAGIEAGEFRRDAEPELVANIAITMCEIWPLRRFAVGRFGLKRVEEEILALLLPGLQGKAA